MEFRDVSFGYTGSGYAVKDLTFTIKKGSVIGIIGGTGAGKSTLVNLIPRFYDAAQGQVLVDGADVKDYSFTQLRSKIGIVPQKAELFSGTIKDNLRFGKRDASDADIERALKISQSYEFVSKLPEGTDKLITAGGKNLSGGGKNPSGLDQTLSGGLKKPKARLSSASGSGQGTGTGTGLSGSSSRPGTGTGTPGSPAKKKPKAVFVKPHTDVSIKPFISRTSAGSSRTPGTPKKSIPAATAPDYKTGDRVLHIRYGEGTVTAIEKAPRDYKVTVIFDDYGQKIMYAGFAKLRKL